MLAPEEAARRLATQEISGWRDEMSERLRRLPEDLQRFDGPSPVRRRSCFDALLPKIGGMLFIVPVHSQHRGRLFLPFADDDPKTAEILSKVILLANDREIKDPTILGQIRG